ncbi:MAG: transcription termination factor Rho [Acidimicrobiales bacterium]|nr:transcription termination factor Rho [Acidimicrobiales bacterium]
MSAQGFDQAVLESKDRAELATIAEQLGRKPGARAKKADIIALIMELVGAPEGGGDGDASGDEQEASGSEGGSKGGAPKGGDQKAAGSKGGQPEGGEQQADGPKGRGSEGGGRDADDANKGDDDSSGGDDEADGTQGGSSQGGGQGDEPEPGNRRRRRRGRDRNRNDDDQVQAEPVEVEGMVDLRDEGYGFLRVGGYLPSRDDAYVSVKQVRQFGLRDGDIVTGKSRAAARNEKNPALIQVDTVNGHQAHNQPARARFEDLTPLFPDERLTLERPDDPAAMTVRIIDLIAPIGKGQRGLIVSPPKAGKTTIMKDVVRSIETNHPDVELIVLLVDERPEEVTDMARWLRRGTVAASTFDRPPEEHTAVAELVIERAKRLVEEGRDVVVVLDGITRLARAYNLAAPQSGRTMAGGLETSALYPPKKFFGAARNAEEGGSLTILATALVETNTRMDEVIFEEFKGTGNMELRLSRSLADKRIFPAVDLYASSTRREEELLTPDEVKITWRLRRALAGLELQQQLEVVLGKLKETQSNVEFLVQIQNSLPNGNGHAHKE